MNSFQIKEEIGVRRKDWPVTGGIPVEKGRFNDTHDLCLKSADEKVIQADFDALSRYDDNSIKWLRVSFEADIEPFSENVYHISRQTMPDHESIQLNETEDDFVIKTHKLEIHISKTRYRIFDLLKYEGKTISDNRNKEGFEIIDEKGISYSSSRCCDVRFRIEEHGGTRFVLRAEGTHVSEQGNKLFDFVVRYFITARSDVFEVDHTFINREDAKWTRIKRIGYEIEVKGENITGLCGNYSQVRVEKDMFSLVADDAVAVDGTRQNCDYRPGGVGDKRNTHDSFAPAVWTHGWIGAENEEGGLCSTIYRMIPNHPKALIFDGKNSIDTVLWFNEEDKTLDFAQGWAKTHKLFFYAYAKKGKDPQVNRIMGAIEQPLVMHAKDGYTDTGLFGDIIGYSPEKYPQMEMLLRDSFYIWKMRGNRLSGMIDYGDWLELGWADSKGRQYKGNMYFDYAHSLLLQYLRTGESEYYFAAESAIMHHLDIDMVHHSRFPEETGGIRCEGPDHGANIFDHAYISPYYGGAESLIEFFCLSGDGRVLELAKKVCRAHYMSFTEALCKGEVNRTQGWVLITLAALHEATGDEKAYESCRSLSDYIIRYIKENNDLKLTIGFGKVFSNLHATTVAAGMYKYYSICRDENERGNIKGCIIQIVDSMIEQGMFPDGGFIYVDYPDHRWNWQMGEAIESFGYAYALTGDEKYIRVINKHLYRFTDLFFSLLHPSGPKIYNGQLQTTAGVTIGINWRGLLKFMYWADRSGLGKDVINI